MGVQSELDEPILRCKLFPNDLQLWTELHQRALRFIGLHAGALVHAARSGQQVRHSKRRQLALSLHRHRSGAAGQIFFRGIHADRNPPGHLQQRDRPRASLRAHLIDQQLHQHLQLLHLLPCQQRGQRGPARLQELLPRGPRLLRLRLPKRGRNGHVPQGNRHHLRQLHMAFLGQ